MHSICIEEQSIVVKFGSTSNSPTNEYVLECIKEAGYTKNHDGYIYQNADLIKFENNIKWTVKFLIKELGKEHVDLCTEIENRLSLITKNEMSFEDAKAIGEKIKRKKEHTPRIAKTFCRELMEYQKESVEHMMTMGNAANFSVPGSGKTTITYAAISKWLENNTLQKILVIGPTASFLPWEEEYESCFGREARSCRVSGEVARIFHELGSSYDLFLMHFQTAMYREYELKKFMENWKTALIIDESHYIKNPNLRKWATMALKIAPYAERRIILSGTPMPNTAKDLWTQITFLWPKNKPLGNQTIYNNYAKRHGIGKYGQVLNSLFCRITKNDLHLPEPKWHSIKVPLNAKQQSIYAAIGAKTLKEFNEFTIRDQGQLQKFRMARMIRLLQTASNPSLLYEQSSKFYVHSDTFSEEFGFAQEIDDLPKIDSSLIDQIKNYSQHEIPSKMIKARQLAEELINKGNKVIIWNSFIHNMSIFKNQLLREFNPIVINGTVTKDSSKPENRDELINKFKNNSESKILVASPASLGESVSLHKNLASENVCNHAIYLDRNFNGAQYMQSMDRIHRIGMDESAEVNYYLIIAEDTIDEVVDMRLNEKWGTMLNALQDDMLQSLEINPEPYTVNYDELNEDYKQTITHLRKSYSENDSHH